MEDPIEELTGLLMQLYQYLAGILHIDINPLVLAHIIWILLSILAIVLRILKYRRLSKAIAIIAITLSMPPLLLTIASIIDTIIQQGSIRL